MAYKVAKKSSKVSSLVGTALLAALSIILKGFSIMIPLAGLPALRFGFLEIPIMLSGILYGPLAGILCGVTSDVVGYFIFPQGAFFPGFTISAAMWGAIPGLFYLAFKQERFKIKFNIINMSVISLLGIGVIHILISNNILTIQNYELYLYDKQLSIVYIILYVFILLALMLIPIIMTKKTRDNIYSLDKIAFTVAISYLVISLVLNTLWLSIMFEQGFIVFLPGRILAALVVIPLHSTIIYTLSGYFKYFVK